MKKLKKYFLLLAMAAALQNSYAQQTVQFSQYMFNGLVVNPAYAGYKEDWTLNLSSRLQWAGIDGAPRTNTISIDGVLNPDNKNMALGFLATNDRLGPENNTSFYANYAYRLRLDDEDTKRLSFGFGAGLVQYRIDASKFNANDPTDGNIIGNENTLMADFRLGVYYTTPSFYVGGSVLNLFSKPVSGANTVVINPVPHGYLTTGMVIALSNTIDIKPSVMLKGDLKSPAGLDLTTYLLFDKKLWLGASYNTGVNLKQSGQYKGLDKSNTVTGIAQFNISDFLRFGYSYDFSTSALGTYQSGTHEVSLSLSFRRKQPRVISPRFF
ncbi:type IX secretion system membrane protein PorP/SprF [Mucilaginibacter sp. ZT4R22]|uniref:Type IX secretion system membrane protein PorP/SprF n=1 Tax=Mucilaginibacter pankratovii TaxID=2772110 RepID=A0ABR7WJ66_9SPHI|nr:type IX secretion system membrane protein PorP/SprF [Mucilaginibacter pankratovii]MBD1362341.1 type IX secretion system membrane protein PorP/SprF [Mucilaginibacter pankratovii]